MHMSFSSISENFQSKQVYHHKVVLIKVFRVAGCCMNVILKQGKKKTEKKNVEWASEEGIMFI
jgi:uncharacterized membrane protein